MKIPNSRYRGERDNDQAMTSMIDVVFLLLIFFVCASIGQVGELLVASDMSQGSIEADDLNDPQEPKDIVNIVIRNNADGQPEVRVNNGEPFAKTKQNRYERRVDGKTLTDMLRTLAEIDAAQPVVLDIGDDVQSGDYMIAYTAAQNAGFVSISYAIDSP